MGNNGGSGQRRNDPRSRPVLAVCLISLAVIFVADILTPVGMAVGILYIVPIGLTLFVRSHRTTCAVAIVATILIPIGYFLSPPGNENYSMFNRAIAILAIWVMATLVVRRKRAERTIERTNEDLEHRVQERTRDLSESETKYRSLFDNLQEAVALYEYVLDEEGEVIDWRYMDVNRSYPSAFGLSLDDIIGKRVSLLLGPESMAEYLPIVRKVKEEKRPATQQSHYAPLDLEVLNLFAPVNEEMFILSSLDITERERSKEELKRSNAELQQFAYIASHDLKEPLRMVTVYLSLLDRRFGNDQDEKTREYMAFARDGARRMQGMIDDLLTYSRVESVEKDLSVVDMNEVLATVLYDLRASIEESGASITGELLPTVTADSSRMLILLENLVSNAIKYRGLAAPQVHISAYSRGREWVFSVADNGIGIDPRFQDRLFKMFERLHTREEYRGTGMGLAIARRIVEQHGGRIWFESEPEKGTTFFFTLPITRPRR